MYMFIGILLGFFVYNQQGAFIGALIGIGASLVR